MSHDNHDHIGHEEEHYNFFETMTYPGGVAVFAVFWTIVAITFITLIVCMG